MVWDRAILAELLAQSVFAKASAHFPKNCSPAICGHVEFILLNKKNVFISETVQRRVVSAKCLVQRVYLPLWPSG